MLLHSPIQPGYEPKRIVSLVPSQTELLFHLGLDDSVAGITKFCVHPPGWKTMKTVVGGTKNINLQKIKDCNPDLIIANKEENIKEQVEALAEDFNVYVTDVSSPDDALKMVSDLGQLTNTKLKATGIIDTIKDNFKTLRLPSKKIEAAYLIWRKPYMTAGGDTFINDMLTRCGFENIFKPEKRYPAIEIEDLSERGCDVLLLSSEPYPFKQKHIKELREYLPGTKIILVDGEMFSWYGSRLLQAPAYFNSILKTL